MAALSDSIENFLKALIMEDGKIEVQRNELAQHFRCAPSQINYVLATRFSPERGYIIQSRRGGAGYVRIVRIDVLDSAQLLQMMQQHIGTEIGEQEACGMIDRLADQQIIRPREGRMMKAAVSNQAINVPVAIKDHLRAGILRNMVLTLMAERE